MAPAELERFRQEPYVANKVGHPGIVRIYDDGVDELGLPYFVMDLLEGECAGSRIGKRRSSPAEVYRLIEGTLSVLEKAHAAGVLHRDIKPSNLFVCKDGSIRVLDFGIARADNLSQLTANGMVLGTPAFMPPEQALGQRDALGPPTDLFAVGATGLVLLKGSSLRGGHELALAALFPLPTAKEAGIQAPRAFLAVLEKACSFDIARRYPTARDMLVALRATEREVDAWEGKPQRALFVETSATVKLEGADDTDVVIPLADAEAIVLQRRIHADQAEAPARPPVRSPPAASPYTPELSLEGGHMWAPSPDSGLEGDEEPPPRADRSAMRTWFFLALGLVVLVLGAALFAARLSASQGH